MIPFEYSEKSQSSILNCAQKLVGKKLSEILHPACINEINSLKGNKGGYGQIIEKYIFGKKPNSSPKPDFECGVDCKVTPLYKKISDGNLAPKERLVCNIINFLDIVNEEWESSSFLKKNSNNLIIRYIDPRNSAIHKSHYQIVDVMIFDLKESIYYEQFKNDWVNIVDKIKSGKAHEISESDTKWLGACTKGANKDSLRNQPNSTMDAMQRAFSFKQQFMKQLLSDYPISKDLY